MEKCCKFNWYIALSLHVITAVDNALIYITYCLTWSDLTWPAAMDLWIRINNRHISVCMISPLQWPLWALFHTDKLPRHEADYSPPSSTQVKSRDIQHSPLRDFMACTRTAWQLYLLCQTVVWPTPQMILHKAYFRQWTMS